MSDTEISVKISADASGVGPGVQVAKGEIQGLAPVLEQLNATMTAMAADMKASMLQASTGTRELSEELKGLENNTEAETISLKEMALTAHEAVESFNSFKSALSEIAEVYLVAFEVERIKEWSKEMGEAGENIEHLAQRFGMETEQIQALQGVATATGIAVDALVRGMQVLDRNIFKADGTTTQLGETLKSMGISAKNSGDQMTVIAKVADRFKDMADGPAKVALAMTLFGRAGAELIPILDQGGDRLRELEAEMDRYGVKNADAVADAAKLGEAWNENAVAGMGLSNIMAQSFAPTMTVVVKAMNDLTLAFIDSYKHGGEAKAVMDDIAIAGKALIATIATLGTAFSVAFTEMDVGMKESQAVSQDWHDNLVLWATTAAEAMEVFADVCTKALHLDFAGAKVAWQQGFADLRAEADSAAGQIANNFAVAMGIAKNEAQGAADDIAKTIALVNELANANGSSGAEEHKPKPPGGDGLVGGKGKDTLVADLEARLNAKKLAWAEEQDAHGTAIEFDKQIEANYWKDILDHHELNSKQRSEITQKYLTVDSELVKDQIANEIEGYKLRLDAAKGDGATRLQIATEEAEFVKAKFGDKSKEYKAAEDQILKITQENAEQRRQIEADLAKTTQQLRDIEISDEQRDADFRVKMGLETARQLIEDEKAIAAARRDAALASVDQQIKTTPKNDALKLQQLADQKLVINRKYQSELTALEQKAEIERTQIGRTAITSVANTWAQSLSKLATLQAGFAATLKSLYQGTANVAASALTSVMEKWLVKKITAFAVEKGLMSASTAASLTGEAAKTAAATAGAATRTATDIAAAVASKATALAQISTLAGIAGAGGTASMAAAPWPLDMGAPAFGATMAASAMGFSSMIAVPAFDTGALNISKDQLAMVHGGEMIIPADQAGGWRAVMAALPHFDLPSSMSRPYSTPVNNDPATSSAAGNGSGGGRGGDIHYHDHTGTLTPDQIIANRGAVAKALKMAHREGRFVGVKGII